MSDVVRIEVSRAGALAIRDGLRFAEEGDRGEAWRAVLAALGDATRQEMGGVTDAMRGVSPTGLSGAGLPSDRWLAGPMKAFQQMPVVDVLPRYTCPTHGEIGRKVLEITGLDRSGAWCGECIAEALGRAGVQRAVRR